MDFERKLKEGESETLSFVSSFDNSFEILASISGMSNSIMSVHEAKENIEIRAIMYFKFFICLETKVESYVRYDAPKNAQLLRN